MNNLAFQPKPKSESKPVTKASKKSEAKELPKPVKVDYNKPMTTLLKLKDQLQESYDAKSLSEVYSMIVVVDELIRELNNVIKR